MAALLQRSTCRERLHDPSLNPLLPPPRLALLKRTPPRLFPRVCIPAKKDLSNLLLLILVRAATISILPKGLDYSSRLLSQRICTMFSSEPQLQGCNGPAALLRLNGQT